MGRVGRFEVLAWPLVGVSQWYFVLPSGSIRGHHALMSLTIPSASPCRLLSLPSTTPEAQCCPGPGRPGIARGCRMVAPARNTVGPLGGLVAFEVLAVLERGRLLLMVRSIPLYAGFRHLQSMKIICGVLGPVFRRTANCFQCHMWSCYVAVLSLRYTPESLRAVVYSCAEVYRPAH